ncbi:MAG: DNA translocase FtsK [Planctomycetota bacterium]|jgi:hypothetical protein
MKEDPRMLGAARVPTRSTELVGGLLFLAGSLPAVALLKAFRDGTDLASDGLGGTALLAARISAWVGLWPGLLIAGSIALAGTMAVLGAFRTDLLRRAVGVVVCGLGVAAISSALVAGSGGRIGDGTGARLAEAVGVWAGVLAGLAVVLVALWLAFAEPPASGSRTLEVSLDGPDLRRPRASQPTDASTPAVRKPAAADRKKKARRVEAPAEPVAPTPSAGAEELSFEEPVAEPFAEPFAEPTPASTPVPTAGPVRAAEHAPEAVPTESIPPQLGQEPDPVVDGPSSAAAGPGLVASVGGWLADVRSSLGAVFARKRPRVAMPAPRRGEPQTLGDALVQGEAEGVSHDEASALSPDENTLAYMEEVWRKASAGYEQAAPVPPSPYPDDPRLKGEIPPGTSPLGGASPDAEASGSPGAEAAAAPVGDPDVAPFDLLDDFDAATGAGHEPAAALDAPAAPEVEDLPPGVHPLRDESADVAESDEEPFTAEDVELPRPAASWEVGYESEAEADGHWTRVAVVDGADDEGVTAEVVEADAELEDEDTAAEEAAAEDTAEQEYTEEPEAELDDEDPEVEDPEVEDSEVEDSEEEDPEEDDADEEEAEAELEDGEEEESEEVEYEYVDEDGNPVDIEALEDGEYEVVDEDEYEEVVDEEEEYEEEDEDEEEESDPEDAEAELDEEYEEAEVEDDEEYEEAEEEAAVVLEPHSPPASPSPPSPQAPRAPEAERLLAAGRVLVRQGRVAVSVLQQELDMEFDEACELLDRLQAEGLIGPYKGGKKRDILLTEEEWEDRFARS